MCCYTTGRLGGGLGCVPREEGLGFVRKRWYFYLIKTYILRFNLGDLMESLLNKGGI